MITGVMLCAGQASAQGVQAVRNVAEEAEDEARATSVAAIMFEAGQRLATLGLAEATLRARAENRRDANDIEAASVVTQFEARVRAATDELRRSQDDPEAFEQAVRRYNDLMGEYRIRFAATPAVDRTARIRGFNDSGATNSPLVRNLPIPGPHTLVKDVVWALNGGYGGGGKDGVWDLGVSTNLLGAAAGAAIDLLGSKELTEYVSNNISAGVGLPVSGGDQISASLGLGLGGIRVRPRGKEISLWPVLGFEQADTADHRVPDVLRERYAAQASWTSPTLAVAFVFMSNKQFQERMERGQAIPIITLGLRMPYYFPGDPATALGGLFTDKRNDYERVGRVQFMIGGSLPLLRLDRKKQEDTDTP